MRILITGTTGFIGSILAPRIFELGYDVYSLERYVTGRFALGNNRKIKTFFGDVRDHFSVKKLIREVQPEIIIHLAAISPVSYSYDHPNETLETNLLGTVNLAEICLREVPHLKQFLFASTSETYGNGPTPKTEEMHLKPNSPYAVSKAAAEKYLIYMHEAYQFPVTILKPFNTYGRLDNTHFVVERIIYQMLRGKEVKLGDPMPVRDFMYVEDHINAYLTCLNNNNAIGQIYNFCTSQGIKISQLVTLISNLIGYKGEVYWNTIPKRPLDINILVGDYSKAKKLLGWEPKYSLEKGLKLLIEYWKDRADIMNLEGS